MGFLDKSNKGTPGTAMRRYCGRTGAVMVLRRGQTCPECGYEGHAAIADQDKCGCAAGCGDHAHPCVLEPSHDGHHETPACAEQENQP